MFSISVGNQHYVQYSPSCIYQFIIIDGRDKSVKTSIQKVIKMYNNLNVYVQLREHEVGGDDSHKSQHKHKTSLRNCKYTDLL